MVLLWSVVMIILPCILIGHYRYRAAQDRARTRQRSR
jgi:hypothetical protein